MATGLARAGGKASGPVLRRAKSAGAAYRLWKLQRQAEVDTADLSGAEQKRMTRFLARNGKDGADTLRRMDSESIQRMFRKTCSIGTFRRAGDGCNQLSEEELQDYAEAVGQADVGLGPFYKKIDDTSVSETAAERFVAETGPAGLRLAVKLDSNAFERLVKIDNDAQDAIVEAWRSDTLEVSTDDAQKAIQRFDSLESAKRTEATRLLEDAGGEGVNLIVRIRNSRLEKILEINTEYSREARSNLAQELSEGDVSVGKIEQFATDYISIRHESGSESIVQDIARQDDVGGPMYEARVAVEVGTDRIDRLSAKVGSSGEKGELDIVLNNGGVIEIKDKEWDQLGVSQFKDVKKKIGASTSYKSMDGNTITYMVRELHVGDKRKTEFLEGMEEKAKEEYGVSIEIKIKDDLDKA
ncbi:hypothetical protein [Halorussus lipolyticus]|uniref:hypothetical protein n=1 Tax=Halorussus lipolyticus TaxID=3034024 RepID=UPI0023E8A35A|nr:hypothetical protein [Halorussus sp. DT80]